MTNIFEVCQWLILKRLEILVMAIQMQNSMHISLDASSTAMITQPIMIVNNEDKVYISKDGSVTYRLQNKLWIYNCKYYRF